MMQVLEKRLSDKSIRDIRVTGLVTDHKSGQVIGITVRNSEGVTFRWSALHPEQTGTTYEPETVSQA